MALAEDTRKILQAIATLASESPGQEARDTELATRLGRDLEEIRSMMEELAQEGYLYLKWGFEPGYSSWLSPKGRNAL